MRPRERNNVFQVSAVWVVPGSEMNEKHPVGLQNTEDLREHLIRPAQVLDRIDCVHDIDSGIGDGYVVRCRLHELNVAATFSSCKGQHLWINVRAYRGKLF